MKGSRILNDMSLLREDKENVVVPTDKTNRLVLVPTGDYADWTIKHLHKDAKTIQRSQLTEIYVQAKDYAERLRETTLSDGEYQYLRGTINKRAVPTPQLLVKDHKKKKEGLFPTRLVIPAKKFYLGVPKPGLPGNSQNLRYHRC